MPHSSSLAIVISDIHLQPKAAEHPINQHFVNFLQTIAPQAPKLFILGDLFEVWLGDDMGLEDYATELKAIQQLIHQGTQVFVQFGNRDFLMKNAFTTRTGIELLPEEYTLKIGKHDLLMVHGDQLCTQDVNYQKMRKWFRKAWVQWLFLRLPKSQRRKIGHKMRQTSSATGRSKNAEIMDAQPEAIAKLYQRHPEIDTLIHGHTHQPTHDQFKLQHTTLQRYVLCDWRPDTNYLMIDATSIHICPFPK